LAIARQFTRQGRVIDAREFGSGNINDTFVVTLEGAAQRHFILQRINTLVFHEPLLVMRNMRIATLYIRSRLGRAPIGANSRFEVPRVLLTGDGSDHWIDSDGSFWRAVSFIEGARSFNTVKNAAHAKEVGYAVGMFHALLDDLPSGMLTDTLKGFHVTPLYLRHYDHVLAEKSETNKAPGMDYCLDFVNKRRAWARVLEVARAEGKLRDRAIHGDPKVDNVMIDASTGRATGIVDLDTVRPGLVHYDIGDCLRSGCNPVGEGAKQLEDVYFDTDLCRAILEGYFSTAGRFLTENDFDYLYDSIRLITFELGLRFFTDYLEGNVYFKVERKEHNLIRALIQFKLTESIEAQEKTIRAVIGETRRAFEL
jgi:Ser/Thr protein kinase RdoA (MazF antagonist)